MKCTEIDREMLLDFIIKQRDRNPDISNRTLNKYVLTLKQALKYACDIDIHFDKMPEQKKIIETIPESMITTIFNYYENNQSNIILQRNYIMFRLLNETGLRITELLNLKISDFDFNSYSIHVKKTKTNVERYVFYGEKTNLLINRYIMSAKLTNHLFIDFVTGDIIKDYTLESICQRLRDKLSLNQSISPHKWRHTFATRFVQKNGNLEVLRQILGHTSISTTQKYLHINKDALRDEYVRVSKI